MSGEIFKDTVTLAGLTATGQAVVAASQYSSGFALDVSPPDGLLGMAFQSIANTGDSPVAMTLISQGKTTDSVYGFTLLDDGGELFLGGTDTTAFSGSLTNAKLITTPAFWEISVEGASVGSSKVVTQAQDAIVDTGTTLLIVDNTSANNIFAKIPGAASASRTVGEGFFTIPCNNIPDDVSIEISGTSFTLSPDTLNFGQVSEGSSDCVAGIMGDSSEGKNSRLRTIGTNASLYFQASGSWEMSSSGISTLVRSFTRSNVEPSNFRFCRVRRWQPSSWFCPSCSMKHQDCENSVLFWHVSLVLLGKRHDNKFDFVVFLVVDRECAYGKEF